MSLLTSSIDLDMIEPPSPSIEAQFESSEIEYFANLLLKSGDTVRPIILSKISPIAFRILEGYFEYYAALKAQEMDEQFTAIRAYVAPKESEASLLEQYHFLRDRQNSSAAVNISNPPITVPNISVNNTDNANLDQTAQQLESSLNQALQGISQNLSAKLDRDSANLSQALEQIESRLNRTVKSLFTDLSIDLSTKLANLEQRLTNLPSQTSQTTISPSTKRSSKPVNVVDPTKVTKILEDLNRMSVQELQKQIAKSKPKASIVVSFAEAIHKGRQISVYTSLTDVYSRAKVAGLAEKTFDKIINAW